MSVEALREAVLFLLPSLSRSLPSFPWPSVLPEVVNSRVHRCRRVEGTGGFEVEVDEPAVDGRRNGKAPEGDA